MNDSDILEKIGSLIKKKRELIKISQENLALTVGLDRTYISGVERGKRNVSILNIFKIANGLGVPAHSLLCIEESQNA